VSPSHTGSADGEKNSGGIKTLSFVIDNGGKGGVGDHKMK
jgi:hypothetical protein